MRTAGFSLSLYCLAPCVKSILRLTASRRLTWPLIMLVNVGAFESMGTSTIATDASLRMHTLKVSHERFRTAVQRVDDHLAVSGACDLDAPILEARGGVRAEP